MPRRPFCFQPSGADYEAEAFAVDSAPEVVEKVDCSWLPMPCMAVIAATAMRAAIRPYSIAVAPASLRSSLLMNFMICLLLQYSVTRLFPWPGSSNVRLGKKP